MPPLSNVFSVDPPSGDISPVSELDRETTDYYNLTVRVTDGGSPGLSDNAVVEIRITDVNDNRPKFNSSREDISVLENSPIGKVLFKVAATDEDIGVNAELRYTIKRGNEEAMFKLDADTGLLTVLGNIDREKVVSFRLEKSNFEYLKVLNSVFTSFKIYLDMVIRVVCSSTGSVRDNHSQSFTIIHNHS